MSIPTEDVIIHAIAHNIRREIVRMIAEEPKSFSEMLNHFDISTGKLNYHLSQINGFIMKNDDGKYVLSSLGTKTLDILDIIEDKLSENDHQLVKEAYYSQKSQSKSLILQGITIGIGAMIFFIVMSLFLMTIMINEPTTPVILYFVQGAILLLETSVLIWFVRIRRNAPIFIEQLAKHFEFTGN